MNAAAPEPMVPTLLRVSAMFFPDTKPAAPPLGADEATLAAAARAAAAAADAERAKVLINLITKYLKLDDGAAALQLAMGSTDDPAQYDDAALQLAQARAEQSLCKARYDAIDAGGPFSDPGPGAERALLAAIAAVDLARANTDAIGALIDAAHGLVIAYRAEDTKE
jgi:hypothetical protein